MPYNVKYTCDHRAKVNNYEILYTIEILQQNFSGSITTVKGIGDVFSLSYEKIDPKKIYDNPIQKGRLEFFFAVRSNEIDVGLGYDGLSILEEIFAADEEKYKMRLKIDGSIFWTGWVLPDLLEYPEGKYVYEGKIVAKDLTRLSEFIFSLSNDRVRIIEAIADFLDPLGLDLDITSYTSWITSETNNNDDYLNKIYIDRKAFRVFGNSAEEEDEALNHEELLEILLRNNGLILRQMENQWRLYQLSAFEDPTNVQAFTYNSSGSQISSSSVNLTQNIEKNERYILPSSTNQINPAVKSIRIKFNHRSSVSQLQIPSGVYITGNDTKSFTESFISNGEQEIDLTASVTVYHSTNHPTGTTDVMVKVGQYYFDGAAWSTNSSSRITVNLTGIGIQRDDGKYYYSGSLIINTTAVPADATTPIEIRFENAIINAAPDVVADETKFEGISFQIKNPSNSEENSESIDYQIIQEGSFSVNQIIGETFFGDFNVASHAALRFSPSTNDITVNIWQRRGSTNYRNFHENLLKEYLDIQRSATRNLEAELLGKYNGSLISYRGAYLFFLGGELTGKHYWKGNFINISIQESANDTFSAYVKFGESGGIISGGGSGGGNTIVSVDWGDIEGVLSDQTDLENRLLSIEADIGNSIVSTRTLEIIGTTNQILVTPTGALNLSADRSWTLSLPQNIDTAADVIFNSVETTNDIKIGNSSAIKLYETSATGSHQKAEARVDSTTEARLHWEGKNDSGTTTNAKHAFYDGSNFITFTALNGGITIGGVSRASNHTDSSDVRIKSNIIAENPLEIASYAILYSYNKEGIQGRQFGLLAQDLEKASPDLIGVMEHEKLGYIKTLSPYSIASVALAGVSELDKRTQGYQEKIKELESQIYQLNQKLRENGIT